MTFATEECADLVCMWGTLRCKRRWNSLDLAAATPLSPHPLVN